MLDLLPFFATHKYNTNGIAAFGGFFFFCSLQLEEQRGAHLRNAIITQISVL